MSRIMDYQRRVLAAQSSGAFRPGHVYTTEVAHMPKCSYLTGRCNCVPTITAVESGTGVVLVIGTKGQIVSRRVPS